MLGNNYKRNGGFTLIELSLSLGLVGIILLGVNHLMSNSSSISSRAKSDTAIEETLFRVKKLSSNNDKCDQIVQGATNSNNFSFSIDGENFGAGKKIGANAKILSIGSETKLVSDKGSLVLSFLFERSINSKVSQVRKNIVLSVVRSGATGDLKCGGANDIAIETQSVEEYCVSLGGDYSTGSCSFTSTLNSVLEKRISEFLCKAIGGSLAGTTCDQIVLNQDIESDNFSAQKICLSGNCRMKFDNSSCASGYLAGLSVDGLTKECKGLNFQPATVACVPDCSCAASVANSSTCDDGCGGTCQGLDCDYLDRYEAKQTFPATEEEWARNTQVCEYVNYSDLTDPGTCQEDGRIPMSAGICKKFSAGTCSGQTAPQIINVIDNTTCDTGKVCISGSCQSVSTADECESPGACSWQKSFAGESEVGNSGCSWKGSSCNKLDDVRKCQPTACENCVVDPIWYSCKRN
ncbi:prepilin-type N-terminal cleavage/methylation domain-containing protein [Bacteriovorax sp. Seq25_V]|uniref:prepilin-type N-terminal cleavage/methylation domain-containing protein n=1 Tax=Bacteriovorax sp. Seq25_V TaxID=1201288 RepID=UPI00038A0BD8|nr:prepilin-type N-terminal cleavage/methylation domain-containing protein [Bacteriovorax sp. Seq25_V]EQC47743.1 prepilin-type cleavage/methylation N-terminal domain protein [Bacteriovorax sp. Seq25_V]